MKEYYCIYNETPMKKGYPFKSGHTKVIANDICDAGVIFRLVHPDRTKDRLDCTNILTANEFNRIKTKYSKCNEVIQINVQKNDVYSQS